MPEECAEYDRELSHRFIARIHLLGATVWAYGAGGARVNPWTRREDFSRFWRAVR